MSPSPARKKPKKIPPQSDAPPKGHSELPPRLLDKRPGTSRGRGFLDLPPELRNLIYDFALHWPTSKELYAPYNRIIDAHYARQGSGIKEDFPKYHGHLRTPTILLLCRAITRECLPMLRERKLVIDRLPPWLPGALRPMLVSEFIGRRTFQNLRHIEIRLPLGQGHIGSGWVWVGVIDDILKILGERNQFKDLRVVVAMFNFSNRIVWDTELKHLRRLRRNIQVLRSTNPKIWAPGRIDEEYWVIKGDRAQRHELTRLDTIVEFTAVQEIRNYPDERLNFGGLLEFI